MSGLTEIELKQQIDELLNIRDALSQKLRAAQHEAEALAATVEALMKIVQDNALIHISANTAKISADAVSSLNLDAYDAGHLNDFGGGNIGWWQDYIRSELGAAHDFYQSQIDNYAESVNAGEK